jgi:molybdopterin molybdotransferase
MSLISVDEALARVLASAAVPVETETVLLPDAAGRTLAAPLAALRDQPPFSASAMDGYAVRAEDVATLPATLKIVGTSAAGHGFGGAVGTGEAVRIFTGAPLPQNADSVVIQEDAERDGETVVVKEGAPRGRFVRPAGLDFKQGDALLDAGARLDARRIALAAAMGHGTLAVRRRPRIAILATGDELVLPGVAPGPDQIIASNPYAVAALVERAGGVAIDLGIALDTFEALEERILAAQDAGADMLVTLGGASVGEHDLVQSALSRQGMELGFWRVALRPGKPTWFGTAGDRIVFGLPGNPVSSMVTFLLFVRPALAALQGGDPAPRPGRARLTAAVPRSPGRDEAVRVRLEAGAATPTGDQGSHRLTSMLGADALALVPRGEGELPAGAEVDVELLLRR